MKKRTSKNPPRDFLSAGLFAIYNLQGRLAYFAASRAAIFRLRSSAYLASACLRSKKSIL